jgi:hypothetical protein
MDVAATVAVGFGSAVVGAVAGFLGAVYIEWQRVRRRRVGILRALISELRQNGARVVQILYHGAAVTDFSAQTWSAAKFDLAQFIKGGLYDDLDFAYLTLPAVRVMETENLTDLNSRQLLEDWLGRMKQIISLLLQLPEAAEFRANRQSPAKWLEEMEAAAKQKGSANRGEVR